jgi:hypothetical protein
MLRHASVQQRSIKKMEEECVTYRDIKFEYSYFLESLHMH